MDLDGVKQLIESSNRIITWSLCITAGSFIILLFSGYLRPMSKSMRLSYFFFLGAWAFLGLAFKYGSDINAQGVATSLQKDSQLRLINSIVDMHQNYLSQIFYFNLALFTFGLWLCIYLFWFIFSKPAIKKQRIATSHLA